MPGPSLSMWGRRHLAWYVAAMTQPPSSGAPSSSPLLRALRGRFARQTVPLDSLFPPSRSGRNPLSALQYPFRDNTGLTLTGDTLSLPRIWLWRGDQRRPMGDVLPD